MANVNSITFDQAAYNVGATITATVDYTPDAPSSVPVAGSPFTFTANVVDAAGNVVATNSAPFDVNQAQAGDTVSVSDTGNRTWAEGTPANNADGSVTVAFTAAA